MRTAITLLSMTAIFYMGVQTFANASKKTPLATSAYHLAMTEVR
ncbi:MAG TPA: hypothetical protein VD995_34205 [Azospirillum sp.]|nr:hypothetical protein [Azospirillum sp.]